MTAGFNPEAEGKDNHMITKGAQGILEYDQITKHIFVGTNMCCIMYFDEGLLAKGVTVDISLEEERLDKPGGVDMFLWLPTVDHTAPSLNVLSMGVECLREVVRQDRKAYVHCMNGHGRAPTLVAAYLVAERGMAVQEALEFIRQRRSSIHLDGVQVEQLESFHEHVRLSDHSSK